MRRIIFLVSVLFCLQWVPGQLLAQSSNMISGKVTNEEGDALQGVTITLTNQQTKKSEYATTGAAGNFSITGLSLSQAYSIVFEHVGFANETIQHFIILPGENNTMLIRLKLSDRSTSLNEVVVVGYGTARRSDVTGAISSYKPKDAEAAMSVSVDAMLQGKIPGMNVVNSTTGGPGAASSVLIRGANSLRGDNQPLYVIDNIPQSSTGQFAGNGAGDYQVNENPLTNLNPSDIEDVQVLKDASATAIYGSRGANGVILITTKKGRSGKAKINLATNVTVSQVTRKRDMLQLKDYATLKNEQMAYRRYIDTLGQIRYVGSGSVYDPLNDSTYHIITNKNWEDAIYRNAVAQNYNLTVNGGSNSTTYFASGSYKDIKGIVNKTGMQIANLRLNLNSDLSNRLKMKLSLNGSMRRNNMMNGGDSRGSATGSIVSAATFAAPFQLPASDPSWQSSDPTEIDARTTPLSWMEDYDDISNEKNFGASLELNWKISNAFSYSLRTGGNLTLQDRARWFGLQLFKGLNSNGYLTNSSLNRNNFTVENLLNYQTRIGDAIKLTALAGVTYDKYKMLNKITSGNNFNYYDLRTNGMNFATVITPYVPLQKDYQLLSYLSRVNMSFFEDRFLATLNMRADGSSKFYETNRWAYFPSAALAWRLEKERFIQDLNWIEQLKLRVGYGKTGNQGIDPYSTLYAYNQTGGSYYATNGGGKVIAINVSGLPNKDIIWETTSTYNAGIDFGFFGMRLSGSIDVYQKTTNDLLIRRDIPPSTSFGSVTINQGSLQNRGMELTLVGDIIKKDHSNFTLAGNIGFNKPIIQKLGLPEASFGMNRYVGYLGNSITDQLGVGNIFVQGYAPGMFYGYQTNGIYQTGENITITKDLTSKVPVPGDIRFVDQNNDNIIDAKDLTILGNPNPKFTYGLQPSFSYRNLNISAAFNGVYGNQILNANLRYEATPSRQSSNIRQEAFDGRWTVNSPSNLYPAASSQLPNVVMDRYIENGSYLRWADLTIGYTLPASLLKSIKFSSLNIYASGKNLALFTKYSGYDPEVNTFAFDGLRPGIDYFSYPNSKSFTLGINIGF